MMDKMEYQGLWVEDEKPEIPIYKVTEFYDWHNTDPVIISTVFMNKEAAELFSTQRIKEIPNEMWGYDDEDMEKWVTISQEIDGSICITNDNDYAHVYLEEDRLHLFPPTELWSGD